MAGRRKSEAARIVRDSREEELPGPASAPGECVPAEPPHPATATDAESATRIRVEQRMPPEGNDLCASPRRAVRASSESPYRALSIRRQLRPVRKSIVAIAVLAAGTLV